MRVVSALLAGFVAGLLAGAGVLYGGLRPEVLPYVAPHLAKPAGSLARMKKMEKRLFLLEKQVKALHNTPAGAAARSGRGDARQMVLNRELERQVRLQALLSGMAQVSAAYDRGDEAEGRRLLKGVLGQSVDLGDSLPAEAAQLLGRAGEAAEGGDPLALDRLRLAQRLLQNTLMPGEDASKRVGKEPE